jgi:predicted nuclease of predicted toxin-antitoxin system
MKRVLLDHCVPRTVRQALANCEVKTTHEMGWNELKNGELLRVAEAERFDVLVTADKNLRHQQNLAKTRMAIGSLPTNTLQLLLPLFPVIAAAVNRAAPTSFEEIPAK